MQNTWSYFFISNIYSLLFNLRYLYKLWNLFKYLHFFFLAFFSYLIFIIKQSFTIPNLFYHWNHNLKEKVYFLKLFEKLKSKEIKILLVYSLISYLNTFHLKVFCLSNIKVINCEFLYLKFSIILYSP